MASDAHITMVSGLHSGAQFTVADGDLIVVGAGPGCDICLSDAGIAPRHAAIALHGTDITVRSLDGTVSVNRERVEATRRMRAHEAAVVALGSDDVRLEIAATAGARAASPRPALAAIPSAKRRAWALLCFSLFAVVATVLVARKLDASLGAQPARPAVAAAVTKEDLIEQVRDVFRIQGYDANITYLGGARLRVDNLDETNERVRHAAEQVRRDVPQLGALVFASPDDTPPPSDAPPYGNGAGDRIVTRIDGDFAYLVAGAGTRYFTGSKLPSGHTIRRITREAVQVERDGQIEWLRF